MPPSREPKRADIAKVLKREVKRDGKRLAGVMFPPDAFQGTHEVSKPEFLRFVRQAWMQGVQTDTEYLHPVVWRQKLMERYGAERFFEIAHEAFGLAKPSYDVSTIERMSLEERVLARAAEMADDEMMGGDVGTE